MDKYTIFSGKITGPDRFSRPKTAVAGPSTGPATVLKMPLRPPGASKTPRRATVGSFEKEARQPCSGRSCTAHERVSRPPLSAKPQSAKSPPTHPGGRFIHGSRRNRSSGGSAAQRGGQFVLQPPQNRFPKNQVSAPRRVSRPPVRAPRRPFRGSRYCRRSSTKGCCRARHCPARRSP